MGFLGINSIVSILINSKVETSIDKICDLLENLKSFDRTHQQQLFVYIISINPNSLQNEERKKILYLLRDKLFRHRKYTDVPWRLSDEILIELEKIYYHFDFEDEISKYIYLFNDQWPPISNPSVHSEGGSYSTDESIVKTMRVNALDDIYKVFGFEGIKKLIELCKYPGIIGNIIELTSFYDQLSVTILDWFENGVNNQIIVAQLYLSKKSQKNLDCAKKILNEKSEWGVSAKTNLLLSLTLRSDLLDLLDSQEEVVQSRFWEKIKFYRAYNENPTTIVSIAEKLLKANRPMASLEALSILFNKKRDVPQLRSSLISELLIQIATSPVEEVINKQRLRFDILSAITLLQNRNDIQPDTIAQIEWLYMMIFRFEKVTPKFLFKKVSNDPKFFVQLIIWSFKRTDGLEDPHDDTDAEIIINRARISYELLDSATIIPGQSGNNIDYEKLNSWIKIAKNELATTGRSEIGDDIMGKYLSKCPKGEDGIWPHEAVRKVIERISNNNFDTAFACGKQNLRGVTTRALYDGGKQERRLSSSFKSDAKKIELLFPKTAKVLSQIADYYSLDADREDREAELRE